MIQFKHTVIFFIIANILVWSFWYTTKLVKYDVVPMKVEQPIEKRSYEKLEKRKIEKYNDDSIEQYNQEEPLKLENPIQPKQEVAIAPSTNWFTTYWPFIMTILTTVPSIITKWSEMYDKVFCRKKHKRKQKRT
jgi:hypothetical protein